MVERQPSNLSVSASAIGPSAARHRIVVVRHGETLWKSQGRTQGQADSPLTEQGICQVRELTVQLRGRKFDRIITSPLGRAVQTADLLAAEFGISQVQQDVRLAERHEGVLQGLTKDEQRQRFPSLFDASGHFKTGQDIPGAEPVQAFVDRVRDVWRVLCSMAVDHSILVVTHAGVMQGIQACMQGPPSGDLQPSKFRFCEVMEL